MDSIEKTIQNFVKKDAFLISNHARSRMFERGIDTFLLTGILLSSIVIESYPDDEPCPSVLMLGFIDDEAYHVVTGICEDHLRIITIYLPDDQRWIGSKYRRKI